MRTLITEVYCNRELIWALALKDIRVRYKRSVLGFLWALLNPLFMMIILAVVFSSVMHVGTSQYAVFLICALLPWTFFTQALAYAVESMVSNGDLLKKIHVDKSVFPVAAVLSKCNQLCVLSLITLVKSFSSFLQLSPSTGPGCYLPVPFLVSGLFCVGLRFLFGDGQCFLA